MYRKKASDCIARLFPAISDEIKSVQVQTELKKAMRPKGPRVPNSFNLFVQDEMPKLKRDENYRELTHSERMKLLGMMWHSAPVGTRMKYKTQSDYLRLQVPLVAEQEADDVVLSPHTKRNILNDDDINQGDDNQVNGISVDAEIQPSEQDIQVVMQQMNVNRQDAIDLIREYDQF